MVTKFSRMPAPAPQKPAPPAQELVDCGDSFSDPAQFTAGKKPDAHDNFRTRAQVLRDTAARRLPKNRLFQAFDTFVAGVPHEGQKPLWKNTPGSVATAFFATTALSAATVGAMVSLFPNASLTGKIVLATAIVTGNMVTTGRFRALHHTLLHHASHNDFGPAASPYIGEAASMIAFTLPLADYAPKHRHHHGHTADEGDPELETVHALGFHPGMTEKQYWRNFVKAMVAPHYFAANMRRRFRSNFGREATWKHKIGAMVIQGVPLAVGTVASLITGSALPFLVYFLAWLLPLTWGWHVSQTLYVMGLHVWERPQASGESRRQLYLQRTGARFFIDALPAEGLPLGRAMKEWTRYCLRYAFLHLLVARLFCVSGDNSAHDVHHLAMSQLDWPNATYDRPRIVRTAQGKDSYWETCSIFEAVGVVFRCLAEQPAAGIPITLPSAKLAEAWHQAELM